VVFGAISSVPFADEILPKNRSALSFQPLKVCKRMRFRIADLFLIGLIQCKRRTDSNRIQRQNGRSVRSGDSKIEEDLVVLFVAVANQELDQMQLEIDDNATTVVIKVLVVTRLRKGKGISD
jgi:hypothetical protein